MKVLRYIGLMLVVLLLTACSSESDTTETKQPPVINIYVYAPDKPMITRSDIGDVNPISDESIITKLQIWVFDNESGDLVAYYSPESVEDLNGTNSNGEAHYQLSVSEAFAQKAQTAQTNNSPLPRVDVYVVANSSSFGMTFSEATSRTELEAAMIKKSETNDYFGLEPLTATVPQDGDGNSIGLPMSGVQRGVSVSGSSPVYKLPERVVLTRAVSKIRFVFCREAPAEGQEDKSVQISSIILKKWMIPKEEYLFLETGENAKAFHVGSYETVNDDSKEFVVGDLVEDLKDIPTSADPLQYVYQSQSAQEYENLIAEGVTKNELKELGPFYLRESDRQLEGVITYQKGEEAENTATFKMKTAGDFSRNHTWTVYAYYSKSGLVAVTVAVKNWDNTDRSHDVYNW